VNDVKDVKQVTAYVDGGARGNPGPAGWGALIMTPDGTAVAEISDGLPHATNNVAEYRGLIAALEWCAGHGVSDVHVRSDSLLLVQQMRGIYKVKHEGLKPLYGRARLLAYQIGRVTFEHIRRELNREADRLANLAMDEIERRRTSTTGTLGTLGTQGTTGTKPS
jgi:probable phosphoglycerate mutase